MKERTKISALLEETFTHRRHWITSDNPSIDEIHKKYPRLFDYNGEMVIFTIMQILFSNNL